MQGRVQHHDSEGEHVGSVVRANLCILVSLVVLQRKHLHYLVNLLCLSLGGGGGVLVVKSFLSLSETIL